MRKQNVGDGAVAIVSGGDTNIGITPSQMSEIMQAIAVQTSTYAAIAQSTVNDRLRNFEESVLTKFAENNANTEAFKNPDFQFLLGKAQTTYARSGEQEVKEILVDLIAERSKETDRSRLSLTLNSAVEKAAVLTHEEFCALSLCFILKYAVGTGVFAPLVFVSYFKKQIAPLLEGVPKSESSYLYLVSEGCGTLGLASISLEQIFLQNYGGVFSKGKTMDDAIAGLPNDNKNLFQENPGLLVKSFPDEDVVQLAFQRKELYIDWAKTKGWPSDLQEAVWNIFSQTMNMSEILGKYNKYLPELNILNDLWENSLLNRLELNTTGIAIAHSNVQRMTDLSAPLSIWIK